MRCVKVLIASAAVAAGSSVAAAPLPGGSLNPLSIPKYVDPLPIPGVMPPASSADPNHYEIAVRQLQQPILSTGLPLTTVWSYGPVNDPAKFRYPAPTIEARAGTPVSVKWMNQLVGADGNFLPHLLPVDQTLHFANPAGDCMDGTKRPDCAGKSQLPYAGPVPIVPHLHGAHVGPDSDGYPEAWFLPAAGNIDCIDGPGYPRTPSPGDDFFCHGSNYDQVPGARPENGSALFRYPNDQRATTLWYHDHAVGMTRTNVYAGPAGFYLIRGGPDDLPSGGSGQLPGGAYEIPLLIQDKSFNADGSLFYPASRTFFDGYAGPYTGDPVVTSDIAPLHNPEFFGNTMVVNGKTWPYLDVEPRKYRFRILNGSDSRFLILKIANGNLKKIPFTVIGTDGGFLPAPVAVSQLLVGPAERFDVIVDFSGVAAGTRIQLLNVGPDSPYGGPFPASAAADANTTGQVMQIRVGPRVGPDPSAIPALPSFTGVGAATNVRKVSLNELESSSICVDRYNVPTLSVSPPTCAKNLFPAAPISARLGTIDPATGLGIPLMFSDPITENPALGSTETWEISNFTADAHPIHLHQVMFQVVNRQPIGGAARPPEVWESGYKDTVVAYPGEVTRVRARYDIEGLFVWHCHILSHEDNEMMRPYCVGDLKKCSQ